jgi:hypothetical protein
MYQIIHLGRSADEAYKPLMAFKPFVPFRDASCGVSSFHLTVLDCLKVSDAQRIYISEAFVPLHVSRSFFSCRAGHSKGPRRGIHRLEFGEQKLEY